MLMADQQSAELTEPCIGSLDDPATFVTPEFASIFVAPAPAVLAVRHDQIDAALFQSFAQRVGVVSPVGDYSFRLLPRTAFAAGDADFGSVASASVASPGEALSSRTPSGRP